MFDEDDFADVNSHKGNGVQDDPYADLPEGVRRLLRESGTNIGNPEDLQALSVVSVSDLAKMWEEILKGNTVEFALNKMKDRLLRKARQKNSNKVKVQNTLKQQEDEKRQKEEEERRRKEEEEKAIRLRHKELEDTQERLEKFEKDLLNRQTKVDEAEEKLLRFREDTERIRAESERLISEHEMEHQQRIEVLDRRQHEIEERNAISDRKESELALWEERLHSEAAQVRELKEEQQLHKTEVEEQLAIQEYEAQKALNELEAEKKEVEQTICDLKSENEGIIMRRRKEEEEHQQRLMAERERIIEETNRECTEIRAAWEETKQREQEQISQAHNKAEETRLELELREKQLTEAELKFQESERQRLKEINLTREAQEQQHLRLAEREECLVQREEQLKIDRDNIKKDAQQELQAEKDSLSERGIVLDQRERHLQEREESLNQRQQELEQWERRLKDWEERLKSWEAELNERQKALTERDCVLEDRESQLEHESQEFQKRVKEKDLETQNKTRELDSRHTLLESQEEQLKNQETDLVQRSKDLDEKEKELERREKDLALARREFELEEKERRLSMQTLNDTHEKTSSKANKPNEIGEDLILGEENISEEDSGSECESASEAPGDNTQKNINSGAAVDIGPVESNDQQQQEHSEELQNESVDLVKKRTVGRHSIMVEQLESTRYLRPQFEVTKFDPGQKLLSTKKRIWEVDFFGSMLRNLSLKGKVKKEHSPNQLVQVERDDTMNNILRLLFVGASHPYALKFKSAYERDRFYECCWSIRPKLYVWCPDICPPELEKCRTEIQGTFSVKADAMVSAGKSSKAPSSFAGKAFINATSVPYEPISIFCGTWNMANRPPPSARVLRKWLSPDLHDLYAITVEESGYSQKEDTFFKEIERVLGRDYVTVASQMLWDIRVIVLSRRRHLVKITNVEAGMKATGFMRVCGNKGGTAISLRFNETSILFIGCHLAAGQEKLKLRNSNVTEIVEELRLGNKELDLLTQHHHVFWMGDLNYRVDVPFDEALELAENNQIKELVEFDQLSLQIKNGQALSDFKEGKIRFLPTYKYTPGTLNYDTKKKRSPSYTDRILFKSYPTLALELLEYSRCDEVLTSDHVPVYASFRMHTHRPFASIFARNQGQLEVCFPGGLHVRERAVAENIPRPFLTFHGHFIEGSTTETTKTSKNPNPRWLESEVPAISVSTPNLTYLKQQFLVVALRDATLRSEDNLIGSAIIPLTFGCGEVAEPFSEPLYTRGVRSGVLQGRIFVQTRE